MYKFEWNYNIKEQKDFERFVDDMRHDSSPIANYEQLARLLYEDHTGYAVMIELQVPTSAMYEDGEKHTPWLDAYAVKSINDFDASNEIYSMWNKEKITYKNAELLMLSLAKELCKQ